MNAWPWNRLWVQLSIAFSTIVIVAAATVVIVGFLLRPDPPTDLPTPTDEVAPELRSRAQSFLARSFVIISVTGGVLGIIAGVWMGRRIAAPLEELSEGVQAIGSHKLSVRTREQGSFEMVSLAKSFNQMATDLEDAERLRQNLMADVAHELRTPLTVIQSNLRAILDDVYDLDKTEVARLYEQTRHLSRLVDDLHVLSQAEARQLPLNLQRVDVVDLILQIGELFEPLAHEQSITLDINAPQAPVLIEADPARMTQVVQNLLANALHHTPSGGTITVDLVPDAAVVAEPGDAGPEVTITVSDTGTGMEVEHLNQVFNRFYRTDKARARDDGGAGLGLAITRALVEAHGGRIIASSKGLGCGSTFTVTLPMTSPSTHQEG